MFAGAVKADPIIVIKGGVAVRDVDAQINRDVAVPRAVVPVAVPVRAPEPMRAPEPVRVRVQEPVRARVQEPVRVPNEVIDAEYARLSIPEIEETFWGIIDTFHWHNRGDGPINQRVISNQVEQLRPLQRKIFKTKYNSCYEMMRERLELDGMFERNGVRSNIERAKVISHAIAMGHDTFATLFDDPAMYQFLIEANECQSLDDCLPLDLQCA